MGLFDKRVCSICGSEIGVLQIGDKKLADGDLCKKCAAKLSPFFSGYKKTTLAEIKRQLTYREQNLVNIRSFNPNVEVGHFKKVYIDEAAKKFVVTSSKEFTKHNPDLISFSMVKDIIVDVKEDANEIFDTDKDGNETSFDPPKYEYEYSFNVEIYVNHPYFEKITFELSDGDRPTSPLADNYKEYERQASVLLKNITGKEFVGNVNTAYVDLASGSWRCSCGAINTSKFCTECGQEKPTNTPKFCPECGTELKGAKFCPECGYKVI